MFLYMLSLQMITTIRLGKVYLELQSRIEQLAPGWQKLRNYVGTFLLDCSGGHRFSTLSTECTVLQPQPTIQFDRKYKSLEEDSVEEKKLYFKGNFKNHQIFIYLNRDSVLRFFNQSRTISFIQILMRLIRKPFTIAMFCHSM